MHWLKIKIPRLPHRKYINFPLLLRIEGWLLCMEAVMMVIPALVNLFFETQTSIPFFISAGVTGAVGLGLTFIRPKTKEMGRREAILLTGLTWVILSMFGMLPFMFAGTHLSVTDAFFETMSGFTTTGATVLHSLVNVPKSILLWRCLIQWVGGLGILLFTLAVVPMLNSSGGLMVFNAEVTGITHDKLRPRVSATAKGLWGIYIILTAILIMLLSFSDMDLFEAMCYGMSTMSTGGFTTSDAGFAQYNSIYVKVVLIIFMFLGGVNLSLLYNACRGKTKQLLHNTVFKAYMLIIVMGYVLFAINVWMQGLMENIYDVTLDPLFQAVSMLTSTGIVEPDFENWGSLSMIVLLVMMVMGGCAGSTSGGAKIDRFVLLFKFIKNEFYKMMHPNAITTVTLNGKGTPPAILYKTLAFLAVYFIVVIISSTLLSVMGLSLTDSLFCSLQAISNTGLGTDTTGVSGDYSLVSPLAKWILSFVMLVGRLELFTVLIVFTPGFWKR